MAEEGVPFQVYIDAQLSEVRRAAELALQSAGGAVPLKEFFDAILDEQRRGMLVAESEREKAAQALAITLAEQIRAGDQALSDHIEQQVQQIRAALDAAEALEVQRFSEIKAALAAVEAAAEQHVEQLRRERQLVTGGQQEAIAKAEVATEKRFESVNEFRAQLNDTISRFLPREVAEAQIAELRKQMNSNTDRLNQMSGSHEGRREQSSVFQPVVLWAGTSIIALIGLIVVGVGAFT